MLIQEKIKPLQPFRVDNGNIHGHVCVDLHNTKSGFTERIQGDNLVTNAVQGILQMTALAPTSITLSNFLPVATNLLGGLMIFDGRLEQSVTNTMFPGDVHYVGGGGDTTPIQSKMIGSYNKKQSHPINNNTGFTTVWDFSTERANGTISSLARTRVKTGNYLGEDTANPLYLSTSYEKGLFLEDEEKFLYIGGTQKRKIYIDKVPAYWDSPRLKNIQQVNTNFNQGGDSWNYSNKTGIAYSTTSTNEKTNTIYKYDVKKDQMTSFTGGPDMYSPIVLDDKVIYSDGNHGMYVTNLDNLQNTTKIIELEPNYHDYGSQQTPRPIGNAAIVLGTKDNWTSGYYGTPCLLYPDGSFVLLDNITTYSGGDSAHMSSRHNCQRGITFLDDKGIEFYNINYVSNNQGRCFKAALGFLGTIFNLSEPITKTANQTMKITYTLETN